LALSACALPAVAPASETEKVGPPIVGPLSGGGTGPEWGARINPERLETTYELRVECRGAETSWECEPITGPRVAGTLPAAFGGREVWLNVTSLKPGAYWFGVSARNADGKAFQRVNFVIPEIPPGAAPEGTGPGGPYNPPLPPWAAESAQKAAERAVAEQKEKEARERAGQQARAPSSAKCIVPSLVGHTLSGARRLLARAHCTLGHVTRPRAHGGRLHVARQKPARGTRLAAGARVSVRLIV
jgi:hypothetical protein